MDGTWGDYIALLGLVNMLDIPVAVVSSLGKQISTALFWLPMKLK